MCELYVKSNARLSSSVVACIEWQVKFKLFQVKLDGKYTVFGHVLHGLDVLDDLEKVPVDEKFKPITDIKIKHVTIHANPIAQWGWTSVVIVFNF